MQIYESKSRPGQVIHLAMSLADLKKVFADHKLGDHGLTAVCLVGGGCAWSGKNIFYSPANAKPWSVHHEIDDTTTTHTDKTLMSSNIGKFMKTRNFLAMVPKGKCRCELTN